MTKYFKTNEKYFSFINKYKNKINLKEVKFLGTKIKVVYNIIN